VIVNLNCCTSQNLSQAIKDECADTITPPGQRTSNGSSIPTQQSAGRS
jgi:hypothetical protein